MMTEEEAKTKECPFFSVSAAVTGVAVVHGDLVSEEAAKKEDEAIGDASKCKASECMMWRATVKEVEEVFKKSTGEKPKKDEVVAKHDLERRTRVVQHGYCGLAGKP